MVKDHITTHLQGLPFPCEKCDYSFDSEKQLIEHEVKHAEMEYEDQIEKEVNMELASIVHTVNVGNLKDSIFGITINEFLQFNIYVFIIHFRTVDQKISLYDV